MTLTNVFLVLIIARLIDSVLILLVVSVANTVPQAMLEKIQFVLTSTSVKQEVLTVVIISAKIRQVHSLVFVTQVISGMSHFGNVTTLTSVQTRLIYVPVVIFVLTKLEDSAAVNHLKDQGKKSKRVIIQLVHLVIS